MMKFRRPYSLQTKFIIGLISIIMLISIINLTALYYFTQVTLEKEVSARAGIVLKQVDAVQHYVRKKLRPRMFTELQDAFVLEAMSSSYITRSIMEPLVGEKQDYIFRRVAISARNPAFEANRVEQELIAYFRQYPKRKLWEGHKIIAGEKYYVMARPVSYGESCLVCHGRIEDAPVELRVKYGNMGFGHGKGGIDGLDLVGVPTRDYTAHSNSKFVLYVVIYLAMSAFILFLIYLTFQKLVVANIHTLTNHFRKNFSDDKGVDLLRQVEHGDEIEEIIEGMEGLSQHLFEARQQLSLHASDLEAKVAHRTEQLSLENKRHRKDLNLFISILHIFKDSRNRPQLWRNILPLLTNRFQLLRTAYICTFSFNQSFVWPQDAQPPELPSDYTKMLLHATVWVFANKAYVPVGSSDDNIEGLLYLERPSGDTFSIKEEQMLQAVGRQLGIAAENLAALDSILKQTENLQAIFEGISDPLLLIEHNGTVIMANTAASRLREELSCPHDKGLLNCLFSFDNNDTEITEEFKSIIQERPRELVLGNGRSFTITTFPLSQESESSARLIVAVQEDTERKNMLKQMVRSEKMATVGKLAAGLAHELNNPLGVILCYAELLKKSQATDQHQDDINIIIKHISQAQAVLRDMLNFARPKVSTSRAIVIGEIAESVTGVFQVQAKKKGVRLTCHRADEQAQVRVEPQLVEHIVLNLLLNALDAVPDEGGIIDLFVELDRESASVRIRVEDNGCGIEPGNLPLIFDPFFSTKEFNKGTGLGLSVIYGYMNELGGTVQAGNLPGGGAFFELHFPAITVN